MPWRGRAARLALLVKGAPPPSDPPTLGVRHSRGVPRRGSATTDPTVIRYSHRYARERHPGGRVSSYTTCRLCGLKGHYARQCTARPTAEPPDGLNRTPREGLPASHMTIQDLRRQAGEIPAEVAGELADRYASQVRAAMGWGRAEREARLQALARAQIEESRATRDRSTLGQV